MSRVFFISDMHFGHDAIIDYESRPFKNIKEMEDKIVENWNKVVGKHDKVFILGDFGFLSEDETKRIVARLKGKKVLILGNHDKSKSFYLKCGIDEVSEYPIAYKDFWWLSHKPMYMNKSMPYCNLHGHIHSLKYEGKNHFNVSVECIDYTPISFEEIKKRILGDLEE